MNIYEKRYIIRVQTRRGQGPERKIKMNMNDINRIFTDMVSGLIEQGYQINPNTMSGSQGEIAHIDLRKDNEILRVYM